MHMRTVATMDHESAPQGNGPAARARLRRRGVVLVHIGRYLREYREIVRRQTQEEAAAEIGVSRRTLHNMEKGSEGVSIAVWVAAWDYMGQLDLFEQLTHDEHRIADATVKLLQEQRSSRGKPAP
jgi:DNA-binding XRE family transcriptional regulator